MLATLPVLYITSLYLTHFIPSSLYLLILFTYLAPPSNPSPLETTKSFLPNIFPLLSRPPDELWCFPGCPHSHPQCGIIHHT